MRKYPLRVLPHEKRIFNDHLSRSRRIVENTFRILASKFRVFLSPTHLAPKNVEKVTLTSCVLHNFLREKPVRYIRPGLFDREDEHTDRVIEGNWRSDMNENNGMIAAELGGSNNYTRQKNISKILVFLFSYSSELTFHSTGSITQVLMNRSVSILLGILNIIHYQHVFINDLSKLIFSLLEYLI